jgi:uncharacterized protein
MHRHIFDRAGRHLAAASCVSIVWVLVLSGPLFWVPAACAETLLRLADTETVTVAPDELAASLRSEATSASPADAQQRVNAAMADALAQAHTVADVTVSTGAYSVWHVGPTPQNSSERWQASQSLELTSHDSVALLTLVGALQRKGLAIGELTWRLSRETQRKAHDEATRQALAALLGRAQEAAELLHLRFGSFKEVRLDNTAPVPIPRFAPAMATMAATAAAPPSAEAADVPVSATADADAILLPD